MTGNETFTSHFKNDLLPKCNTCTKEMQNRRIEQISYEMSDYGAYTVLAMLHEVGLEKGGGTAPGFTPIQNAIKIAQIAGTNMSDPWTNDCQMTFVPSTTIPE
jgi:hypothetical protein